MTAGERCQPICGRGRVEADGSRAREPQHLLRAEERRGTELQPLPGVSRGAPTRDTRHSAVGPTQGVYILMVMRCLLRGQDAGTRVCPSISGYSPPVCALHKGARLTGNWELNPVLALSSSLSLEKEANDVPASLATCPWVASAPEGYLS